MTELNLIFRGIKPIGKQNGTKARIAYSYKNAKHYPIFYSTPEYAAMKQAVFIQAKQQIKNTDWRLQDQEGLITDCIVYIPRGQKKLDIVDNCLSGFFDALEGAVYKYDSIITDCRVRRKRSKEKGWLIEMNFIKP